MIAEKFCFRFGVFLFFLLICVAGCTMSAIPMPSEQPVINNIYSNWDYYYQQYRYTVNWYTQGFADYSNFGVAIFMAIVGFMGFMIAWCVFCGMGVCCNCCKKCCCKRVYACKRNTVCKNVEMVQVQVVPQVQQIPMIPPQFVMPVQIQ